MNEASSQGGATTPRKLSPFYHPLAHAGIMFSALTLPKWIWWQLGGPNWAFTLEAIGECIGILYALLIPTCILCSFLESTRRHSLAIGAISLAAIIGGLAGIFVAGGIRDHGMRILIEKSQPVIAAIRGFEGDFDSPPSSLEELIPKYLDMIPESGLIAFPNIEYAQLSPKPGHWELMIKVARPNAAPSEFVYRPGGGYGRSPSLWTTSTIDDWAHYTPYF